jgi:AAA+ superfamily predicted ATPase
MRADDWITRNELLPDVRYARLWDSVVGISEIKDRLLRHALLGLTLRPKLDFAVTGLHGLVLLYGPPGTAKTTLGRALPQELAALVPAHKVRLLEINPHGLMSAEHGQSQQRVFELLCDHVPLLADDGLPTVLLLDEVESMAVARSATSLSANPADVHRATDAVLMALDRNAQAHPHLITVATSNFTDALDEAFRSRADAAIEVPLPSEQAILEILQQTLRDFGEAYPALATLSRQPGLADVANALVGLDGRQTRKAVTEALAHRRETVLDPGRLTIPDLIAVAEKLTAEESEDRSREAA